MAAFAHEKLSLSLDKTTDASGLPNNPSICGDSGYIAAIKPISHLMANHSSVHTNEDRKAAKLNPHRVNTTKVDAEIPLHLDQVDIDIDTDIKVIDNDHKSESVSNSPCKSLHSYSHPQNCSICKQFVMKRKKLKCGHDVDQQSNADLKISNMKSNKYKCSKCQQNIREFVFKMAKEEYYDKTVLQQVRSPIYRAYTPISFQMDIDDCLNGRFRFPINGKGNGESN